jgi:squalene-hopene/tetraprenyl-beta-curcumene cyclase
MRPFLVVFITCLLAPVAAQASDPADTPDPADTIKRGLDFLVKDALAWKKERNCVSCHHAALPVWAMNAAKARGHAIDEAVCAELTAWLAGAGTGANTQKRPENAPKAVSLFAVYLSLGLASDPRPNEKIREALVKVRKTFLGEQHANGSWAAWPETRAPLFTPTDSAVTALALLALAPRADGVKTSEAETPEAETPEAETPETKLARDNALTWLDNAKDDGELHTLAVRLMLARRFQRTDTHARRLEKDLLAKQNDDGGWPQTKDMASDAFATGQALYALADAGRAANDAAVRRGQAFLARTQQPDGSWQMTSRPCPPTNKGARNLVPITGAGASWAVLGLARSTPLPR